MLKLCRTNHEAIRNTLNLLLFEHITKHKCAQRRGMRLAALATIVSNEKCKKVDLAY